MLRWLLRYFAREIEEVRGAEATALALLYQARVGEYWWVPAREALPGLEVRETFGEKPRQWAATGVRS